MIIESRYRFRSGSGDRETAEAALWQQKDGFQVRDQVSEESPQALNSTGSEWDASEYESTLTAAATVLTAGARRSSLSIVSDDEDPDPTNVACTPSIGAETSFDDALRTIAAGGGLSGLAS